MYLLEPTPGQDPMETLETRAGDQSPLTPQAAERNRRIADALRAANPAYHPMESTSDEYIAITDQDGIEVTLAEHEVAINFPYWDSLDLEYVMREIERAAEIVTAETGWRLYDPQLETFFDPSRDAAAFREAFGVGAETVNRLTQEEPEPAEPRPPWWKRLFGGG